MNREPVEPAGHDYYAPPQAALTGPELPSLHPSIFCILMIPFGAATGYVSVTLGSLLAGGGVSVEEFAKLAALGTLPHTLKFLWSPVVDVTLTPKTWYILSTLLTAFAVAMLGVFPANESGMGPLRAFVFLGGLTTTVVGMAADILMAHSTPAEKRGRAGGWFQAGNVGGGSIGGGLGLLIAVRVPQHWMASCAIAVICALCCLALVGLPSPRHESRTRSVPGLIWDTLRDAWHTARVPRGLLALILCAVPLGIGASSGLWSAMAPEWNTGEDTVAVVTGILGGIVSTMGCLAGGWFCDRWNRQKCYVGFGFAVAFIGAAMALLPHTREFFIAITLCFSFATGMSWAGYTAFVLDAIGKTGAATKFSAFASLANLPIYYMNYVNAWSRGLWKTDGMLYFEAAMGVAGAIVFLIAVKLLLPRRPKAKTLETPAVP
jgi:PAT family beta-lactamase induction signal transducer AmpG